MNILITGGTSGIGFELARLFCKAGHQVSVVGQNVEKSAQCEAILKQINPQTRVYSYDLAEKSACEDLAKKFSDIDLIINNAGYATYETFEELSTDEMERLIQVNFLSHVRVTKALLPLMIKKRSGKIINISSIAGEIVITPSILYMASKQAINAWSQALSYELSPFNIKVQVVCPGRVATSFFDHPTFVKRKQRPEMQGAMSAEYAAQKIYQKLNSSQFIIYLPQKYGLISWVYRAIPGVREFLFKHLMESRIKDYYKK